MTVGCRGWDCSPARRRRRRCCSPQAENSRARISDAPHKGVADVSYSSPAPCRLAVDRACRPAAGAAGTRSVRSLDRRHPRSGLQRRRRLARSPSRSTSPTTPAACSAAPSASPSRASRVCRCRTSSREGHTVSFEIKANGGGLFKGTQADATSISGEFVTTQGGYNVPFDLKRTGDARIAAAPKSAPIGKELEGTWNGAIDVGGKQERLVLTLTNHADGTATGTIQDLDGSNVEIPIAITQKASNVTIDVAVVGASYTAALERKRRAGRHLDAGPGEPAAHLQAGVQMNAFTNSRYVYGYGLQLRVPIADHHRRLAAAACLRRHRSRNAAAEDCEGGDRDRQHRDRRRRDRWPRLRPCHRRRRLARTAAGRRRRRARDSACRSARWRSGRSRSAARPSASCMPSAASRSRRRRSTPFAATPRWSKPRGGGLAESGCRPTVGRIRRRGDRHDQADRTSRPRRNRAVLIAWALFFAATQPVLAVVSRRDGRDRDARLSRLLDAGAVGHAQAIVRSIDVVRTLRTSRHAS